MRPSFWRAGAFSKGLSLRQRIYRLTAPYRLRKTTTLVLLASCSSDGSPLTENTVFFFDRNGSPLFEGFTILSWNGWDEKQRKAEVNGWSASAWEPYRLVDGWATYSVYTPYLRVEDYIEAARRHARDTWGLMGAEKRMELRLSVLSQQETNQSTQREIVSLLKMPINTAPKA